MTMNVALKNLFQLPYDKHKPSLPARVCKIHG